jgi:hypothetical protein
MVESIRRTPYTRGWREVTLARIAHGPTLASIAHQFVGRTKQTVQLPELRPLLIALLKHRASKQKRRLAPFRQGFRPRSGLRRAQCRLKGICLSIERYFSDFGESFLPRAVLRRHPVVGTSGHREWFACKDALPKAARWGFAFDGLIPRSPSRLATELKCICGVLYRFSQKFLPLGVLTCAATRPSCRVAHQWIYTGVSIRCNRKMARRHFVSASTTLCVPIAFATNSKENHCGKQTNHAAT